MNTKIEIRQVKAADFLNGVPEVSNLLAPQFQEYTGDESRVAYLDSVQQHRYVAVNESGEVVGVATLLIETKLIHKHARVGYVEDVAVRKDMRHEGVGTELIQALQKLARDRGCYKVVLYCSEKHKAFYEHSEFREHNIAMRWDCG